jgi:hypothetical protein
VGDAVCLGVAALLLGCELAVVLLMGYTRWASDYQLDASGYERVSDSQVLMCVCVWHWIVASSANLSLWLAVSAFLAAAVTRMLTVLHCRGRGWHSLSMYGGPAVSCAQGFAV